MTAETATPTAHDQHTRQDEPATRPAGPWLPLAQAWLDRVAPPRPTAADDRHADRRVSGYF
jgi:hypothetical protein